MKFFWPIYLSSLLVGTAGVYVAAPLARPFVAGLSRKRDTPPLVVEAAVPGALPSPAQPPAAEITEPPRLPVSVTADGHDVPPASQGIHLASGGDKPEWGITYQRTSYYKPNGSRQGHVPAGMLVTFKETRQSSKGVMVACQFPTSGSTSDVYLVSAKDVGLFTGTYTRLSSRQLDALQAYYVLNGKISQRKNELLQASAAKNPFFDSYNTTYTVYMAHLDKAKELALQRNRVTDADKAHLEDQLREMKMAEIRLKAEYDAAHLKFRTWSDQHAGEFVKPENDPDVKKWTQEMSELRAKVPDLML